MARRKSDSWQMQTWAIRERFQRSHHGEHNEPLHLSSSFVFESAQHAANRFDGSEDGNIYARFTQPNVSSFCKRLARMEEAGFGVGTTTGMAAILTAFLSHLNSGDHVICADCVFGTTIRLCEDVLKRLGIEVTFVRVDQTAAWEKALRQNTRLLFCESPANPTMEIADLSTLADLAHAHDSLLVVDNCFCTPLLQKPLRHGADVVVHSATKFIDGQGRCLGGALVTNNEELHKRHFDIVRTGGTSMSSFNAWVLEKSLETLEIRMQRHCHNALEVARWLQQHRGIVKVHYPGLPDHPQRQLIERQQNAGGGVLSFELPDQKAAWHLIDQCELLSITANLGDSKSTITHPATTTHWKMSPEDKAAAGIVGGLVRISVGLEHVDDIIADIAPGLS